MREVLALNINRLMEQRYAAVSNRPMALAKDAGTSLSTVQRTLSRQAGASIDTLEVFAKVFGLQAYQLLMPGWLGGAAQPAARYTAQRQPLFRGSIRGNVRKRTVGSTRPRARRATR